MDGNPATSRGSRLFLTLYRLAANCGESLVRPLFLLTLATLISGPVLIGVGMLSRNGARLEFGDAGVLQACPFAAQILLLQKPAFAEPATLAGAAYVTLLQALGPVLLGFLVFAFGRRVTP